jgi:CRISPR-associated protein Csx1
MDSIVIYQIGRLDTNVFKKIIFEINGVEVEKSLSSIALKEYFCKNGFKSKVILIYPISLPFNHVLISSEQFKKNCPESFYSKIEWAFNNPDEYLKRPSELFNKHPHSCEVDDFVIIHSLGKYKTSKGDFEFDSCYSDIMLIIFIDMIKRYLTDEDVIKRIIVDISSGHNIYVSALIESLRYLGTWLKLYKWNWEEPSIEIAFSDPIFIDGGYKHSIHLERQYIKTFFSSPVKNKDDIQNFKLSKSVCPFKNERYLKNKLQNVLEEFAILFSAVKNNTPIMIYKYGYRMIRDLKNTLNDFITFVERKLQNSYDSSPKLNKVDYMKIFLVCGFYMGLSMVLGNTNVLKMDEEGVHIDDIRKKFKVIYELFNLNLNEVILGNEIDKIIQANDKISNNWKPLIEILHISSKKASNPDKRNFFAHAGFEGCITECKSDGEKIFVRYREDATDTICRWLKESI